MSLDLEDEASLRAKLLEIGNNFNEKKAILDARDKLIRLKQEKPTNLEDAVAVTGTCLDMCPEHERYFRIETKQVSPFEFDDEGVVDERRMVKEYRRAGADQKEPLPHELRPIGVLEQTMNYLCLSIVDQYSSYQNLGDWFDFIWSRTRSIRKDITQQHIITPQSVNLIERCARFHIFCAFFLCEEETRNFDHKINEENLSNCLQTLKDFYYDLANRSIFCSNEAEFRAYDILTSLRKGEALSELPQFRLDVRNSPQVKLSIAIYQAFTSHNFFKFFKFARQADFFMSCILNRYFNQFRVKSLDILCKAYTNKASTVALYPTEEIIKLFVFDDYKDFTNFCSLVELKHDENNLWFQKNSIMQPDFLYLTRPLLLVWKKLKTTPGQAIIGSSVASNEFLLPVHTSFNKEGKLLFDPTSLDVTQFQINGHSSTIKTNESQSANQSIKSFFSANLSTTIVDKANDNVKQNNVSFFKMEPNRTMPSSIIDYSSNTHFNNQLIKMNNKDNTNNDNSNNNKNNNDNIVRFNQFSQLVNKNESFPIASNLLSTTTLQIPSSINVHLMSEQIYQQMLKKIVDEIFRMEYTTLSNYQIITKNFCSSYLDHLSSILIRQLIKQVFIKEKNRRVWLTKIVTKIQQNIITNVIEDTLYDIFQTIKADNYRYRIIKTTIIFYDALVSSILDELINDLYRTEIEQHWQRISKLRKHFLTKKYYNKWKSFYENKKKYIYYRETLPAISTFPLETFAKSPIISRLNGDTIIDDQYAKTVNTLKRSLSYTKWRNSQVLREVLQNKANIISAHNRQTIEPIQMIKIQYDLMAKYFRKWFEITKNRKNSKMRLLFPAAPNTKLVQHSNSTFLIPNRSTLIDPKIERADRTIKRYLYEKLNNEYENAIDSAKKKLESRRSIRKRHQDNEMNDPIAKRRWID